MMVYPTLRFLLPIFLLLSSFSSAQTLTLLADMASQPWDQYGKAVAIDGNTAVVGAARRNAEQGGAYVYLRSGTTWTQQALLLPSSSEVSQFGTSVSISDDTIAVGAPLGNQAHGQLYIFVRNAGVWTQQAMLTLPNAGYLGQSVSLSGDRLLAGATGSANGGAAYLFTRTGSVWTLKSTLTPSDGVAGDLFGGAVALDGTIAAVAAYKKVIDGNTNQGAAWGISDTIDDIIFKDGFDLSP